MREDRPEVTELNNLAVVKAAGSLGEDGARRVRAIISSCLHKGDRRLVLDMGAVQYINTQGLRMLQDAIEEAETLEASLALANVNSRVLRTLSITRMDKRLPIFGTVEEAVTRA